MIESNQPAEVAPDVPFSLSPSLRPAWVFQDVKANPHRPRSRLLLVMFRIAQAKRFPFDKRPSFLSYLTTSAYVVVSEWVLGIEIPVKTSIGPRIQVVHGYGLVVNAAAILGADVVLRHGVTIGNKGDGGPSPRIEDGVSIGAGACVLGPIVVGRATRIGANAVVVKDTPPHSVVVGNPGRIIQSREDL